MKSTKPLLCLLMISSIMSVGVAPINVFAASIAEDTSLDFVENVLPIDLSKYEVTSSYSQFSACDTVTYTLNSSDGTIQIDCNINNGVLTSCFLLQ